MAWLISRALMAHYENSRCSQGPEAVSLAESCLDGKPSAPSSGNPTPRAYLPSDRMTAFSRLSRFGMTFGPLTGDRGEDLLTWFRADFLAKISPLQERGTDLMANEAGCGQKWRGSLARYDHDTRSWKTAQLSLLEVSGECLETWPRWGTTRGGESYLLPTPALHTSESESGLWPTPTARDHKGAYSEESQANKFRWMLPDAVKRFPTPKAQDSRHAKWDRGKSNLGEVISGANAGGSLNPTWVEWLMGWPQEWTDLKPLETAKSPKPQPSPGGC